MHYLLVVDETGSFNQPTQSVWLGGWLLNVRDTPGFRATLERSLREAFPYAPWPLHLAELTLPLAPVGWSLRGDLSPAPEPIDLGWADVEGVVRRLDGWAAFESAWSNRDRHATNEAIQTARSLFQALTDADPRLAWACRRAADRRRAWATQVSSQIVAHLGLREDASAVAGVWAPAPAATDGPKRWISAWHEALNTVRARLEPGDQLIVRAAAFPKVKLADLTRADRNTLVLPPSRYNAQVHPGIVLADLAAGPTFRALREAQGEGLSGVEARLDWPVRLPSGPTLEADDRHLPPETDRPTWLLDIRADEATR